MMFVYILPTFNKHKKKVPEDVWQRYTPFCTTGQKILVNPRRLHFCVQWECAHSPFTPRSIDSAVEVDFSYLGSAFKVNVRAGEHAKF